MQKCSVGLKYAKNMDSAGGAYVLRATTKKIVNFLRKKCTPAEKILATPVLWRSALGFCAPNVKSWVPP